MCLFYKTTDVGFPSDGSLFALLCLDHNNLKQSAGTQSEGVGRGARVLLGVAFRKVKHILRALFGDKQLKYFYSQLR